MRAFGKSLVVVFAIIGVVATIQKVSSQGAAPMNGGSFTHVGIVVKDIDKTAQMFADVYGITPPATARLYENAGTAYPGNGTASRVAKAKLMQFTVGNVRIELIEPVEGPTPWKDHLDKYGQGVHHIAFGVPDIEQSLRGLEGKGGRWVLGEPGPATFKYVDMKDQLGYTIELGRQQPAAGAAPTAPPR